MTHKILNGKRLKADKKKNDKRLTAHQSAILYGSPALCHRLRLSSKRRHTCPAPFRQRLWTQNVRGMAIKDGDPNGAQLICFLFGAAKLWFGASKQWFGTSKRWFGAGKR